MHTDLIHRISIAAPAETIYRAITTEEGMSRYNQDDATGFIRLNALRLKGAAEVQKKK
jgi:uncharacterized protein YndB with AHSA1/START domain